MTPLQMFTQVMYKGKVGEIIQIEEGFDYSPDNCMYMLELEDNTHPILKRGEFEVIELTNSGPQMFMGMLWEKL